MFLCDSCANRLGIDPRLLTKTWHSCDECMAWSAVYDYSNDYSIPKDAPCFTQPTQIRPNGVMVINVSKKDLCKKKPPVKLEPVDLQNHSISQPVLR